MFTRGQQIALAVIPKITGSLSAIGSVWIVIEVLTTKEKRHNVYNRLLCMMSLLDCTASVWYFASTWPIPRDSDDDDVVYNVGNMNTCTTQGFFLQFALATPLYNTALAIYYLLVVKYAVSEEFLRTKIEPAMHLICLSAGAATATAGCFLQLFNNADLWCWIAPLPKGCKDSHTFGETTCERGDNAFIYRWGFFYAPLWGCILVSSWAIASVYWTIKRREMEARKPGTHSSIILGASTQQGPSNYGTTEHARRSSLIIPLKMAKRLRSSKMFGSGSMEFDLSDTESEIANKKLEAAKKEKEAEDVLRTIESLASVRKQNVENNAFGSRAVYTQLLFYSLTFFATYTFATIDRIGQQITGENYFGIMVLHVTFIPLQGFFNVVVYRRNEYMRLKQRNPHLTHGELLRRTWRWTFLGPPNKRSRKGRVLEVMAPDTNDDFHRTTKSPLMATARQDTERETRIGLPNEEALAEIPDSKGATMMSSGLILVSGTNMLSRGANVLSNGIGMVSPMSGDAGVPILVDCFEDGAPADIDNVMADLMMSYADFPNMLVEDSVMVTMDAPQAFPTRMQDSFQVTGNNGGGTPQSYPTPTY